MKWVLIDYTLVQLLSRARQQRLFGNQPTIHFISSITCQTRMNVGYVPINEYRLFNIYFTASFIFPQRLAITGKLDDIW